jgi:hypothetical protein
VSFSVHLLSPCEQAHLCERNRGGVRSKLTELQRSIPTTDDISHH